MSQFAAGTLHAGTVIINHSSPPKLPAASISYYYYTSAPTNSCNCECWRYEADYYSDDLVISRFSKKWISSARWSNGHCRAARRRVRDEDDDDEGYGYNEDIEMLELYSQSARGEALLVNAVVDDQEAQVLIFKGFSSSLSHGTASDPSKSVLPARAVIESVDRIKSPFDPSNVEYIERGLTWEDFRSRLRQKSKILILTHLSHGRRVESGAEGSLTFLLALRLTTLTSNCCFYVEFKTAPAILPFWLTVNFR